jgi:hypothetical protein
MALIRCELRLETRDGRVIRHYADPGKENFCSFPVQERGAYYSNLLSGQNIGEPRIFDAAAQRAQVRFHDRFVVSDAAGFFRISLPLHQNEGARLLAVPFHSNPGEAKNGQKLIIAKVMI